MKIQFASDLHIEFAENWRVLRQEPLRVNGDILVLAGDIGYLGDDNYRTHPFWDWASENYQQVIVALGNHEFYKYYDLATMHDGLIGEIRHNVHYYYNTVVRIENVDFIVSTLWANIDLKDAYVTEQCVSDFRRILYGEEMLTFSDFNREHRRCLEFIKKSVAESNAKYKIVVTHHVPSYQLMAQEFQGSKINGAFTVELSDYIEQSGIDFWIYGHSHRNIEKTIGKTHCICNQFGYAFHNEHLTFDKGRYIEV
ncbi:MAG: serine/threonine protein phosphatase [Bacteroidales bacterium]|jgi:predicted phosphodiesterase|nr:serine/threonine protein phosphatase [Bacteroidales bacterium]